MRPPLYAASLCHSLLLYGYIFLLNVWPLSGPAAIQQSSSSSSSSSKQNFFASVECRVCLVVQRRPVPFFESSRAAESLLFLKIWALSFLFLMTGRRGRDVCKIWAGYVSISKSYDQNKFSISFIKGKLHIIV